MVTAKRIYSNHVRLVMIQNGALYRLLMFLTQGKTVTRTRKGKIIRTLCSLRKFNSKLMQMDIFQQVLEKKNFCMTKKL
jgi:hypothetical protein